MPVAILACGCSSLYRPTAQHPELETAGPTILEAHASPSTIHLTPEREPTGPAEVTAQIEDLSSPIRRVVLRFTLVSLEIPMEHVNGKTWRAPLTPTQIKKLTIGGQTSHFEANVIASNDEGMTTVSSSPVVISIAAPAPVPSHSG